MSVEMLPSQERIEITSARVFDVDDDPAGRWLHMIDYVDVHGNISGEMETPSLFNARQRAAKLATVFGCPILDLSEAEEATS